MTRHRFHDYEPDLCCVGCGRTVPASDMVREHCPQCQEDGTLPPREVLRFPVERTRVDHPVALVWFRCAGGCGGLVASSGAFCLRCAVEDR
jgi:hypothetical protein